MIYPKMGITAITALIAVAALIATPIVLSYKAEAASEVRGSGRAAFPDQRVECPNGSVIAEATIEFTATETNGVVSGTWTITSIDPSVGVKSGSFSGGTLDTNRYTLTGTEKVDAACSQFGGGIVPNPMQISGQCGTGVTINFEAQRLPSPPGQSYIPERGTFTGDVTCTSDPTPPQPPLTERFSNQGQCVAYANHNPGNSEGITKEACKAAFQNKSNR